MAANPMLTFYDWIVLDFFQFSLFLLSISKFPLSNEYFPWLVTIGWFGCRRCWRSVTQFRNVLQIHAKPFFLLLEIRKEKRRKKKERKTWNYSIDLVLVCLSSYGFMVVSFFFLNRLDPRYLMKKNICSIWARLMVYRAHIKTIFYFFAEERKSRT